LGEDDKHLDFRLSVLRSPDLSPTLGGQLTVSTVVHCHNLLGRAYILVIAPFHRLVVKASLRRAARIGWPKAAQDRGMLISAPLRPNPSIERTRPGEQGRASHVKR